MGVCQHMQRLRGLPAGPPRIVRVLRAAVILAHQAISASLVAAVVVAHVDIQAEQAAVSRRDTELTSGSLASRRYPRR